MAEDDLDQLERDMDGQGAEGAAADPLLEEGGKKGGKMLFIVIGAVLLLLGGGAGLYLSGMLDGLLGKTAEESAQPAAAAQGTGQAARGGVFLPIPDMIVNLSSTDSTPRYLRLSVQLELASELDRAGVEAVMPRVVDQFQTYLRELRVRDLRGSAGIYRLQMELLARVNEAAYPVVVQDVLFQEILIQ